MKKTDMTLHQLKNRETFVKQLITAGWNPGGWEELFDSDVRLTPEAQAEYQNDVFSIRLSYNVEQDYILLECVEKNTSTVLSSRFYPKQNLIEVIDMIVGSQDSLSPDNYVDFIKTFIPVCNHVLLELTNGLVELS